jgi:hypothetical protein
MSVGNYAGSSTYLVDNENLISPEAGDKLTIGSTEYTWTIKHDDDGKWHDDAGGGEWVALFAMTILSPKDQWVRYHVTHAGGLRIYSNGLKVYGYLERGANQVLFKLGSNTYPRFTAHIDDAGTGELVGGLYYTLDDAVGGDLVVSSRPSQGGLRPLTLDARRASMKYVVRVGGGEGEHVLRVCTLNGRTVLSRRGTGDAVYTVARNRMASNVYVVTVRSGARILRKRLICF